MTDADKELFEKRWNDEVELTKKLRDALHLAYDWMGREPGDDYEKAHFKHAAKQVIDALKA
jgi:predicted metalloendopeptidase